MTKSFIPKTGEFLSQIINIENVGFDSGAHVILNHSLKNIKAGSELAVQGTAPEWQTQLSAWCRFEGHKVRFEKDLAYVARGAAEEGRWKDSVRTSLSDEALPEWGLSARGAKVEAGSPRFQFRLNKKVDVWAENAADLYRQAVAGQWNPDEAIDWTRPKQHSDLLERSLVQVFTYLIENENAALVIPARFLGQVHPHFREVQALLAIQVADEARHIEVFTRRVHLYGHDAGTSTSGGQASLKSLLDQNDFSVAGFLLSVLGEGTFVNLLQFLSRHAPDPVAREIAVLAARDESRHVA
ncbi:MAG: ferritin-like domain-containing protein, partial [Bdellovibrionia bacterium]